MNLPHVPTNTLTLTSTLTATATSSHTPTPLKTPESKIDSTETLVVEDLHLLANCVTILDEIPSNTQIPGFLVLEMDKIYLYNPTIEEKIAVGDGSWPAIRVSPSQSKLAFWDIEKEKLLIVSSDREPIATVSESNRVLVPMQWITEDELIVERIDIQEYRPYDEHHYFFWDLETDNQVNLTPPIPFYSIGEDAWWYTDPLYIVNQSKSHLVFNDGWDVVLWDLKKNKEVIRLYSAVKGGAPKWSPNGEEFVVGAPPIGYDNKNKKKVLNIDDGLPYLFGEDLFIVGISGVVERISYMTTKFNVEENGLWWSPDGTQIAFWLEFPGNNDYDGQLAIIDIETGMTTNYCVEGFQEIYWSHDGKYLAITSMLFKNGREDIIGIVLDIENEVGFYLPHSGYIDGWLKP